MNAIQVNLPPPPDNRLSPARIRELARLLPASCDYFKPSAQAQTAPLLALQDRYTRCLMDPAFGWNFSLEFAKSGHCLPPQVLDADLRAANLFLARDYPDGVISQVYGLVNPIQAPIRNALHGLLICRDISYGGIANWLGIHPEVVRVYGKLMFNVRDRLEDRGLIMSLLYPQTRIVEHEKHYPEGVDFGFLLLRAGFNFGCREVLYLSGLSPKRLTEEHGTSALSEVETAMIDNARTLARHGGLNQKDAPGIQHAKALLLEEKRNGLRQTSNDNMFASLSSLSDNPGFCILEDVKRFCANDRPDLADLAEQEAIWEEAKRDAEALKKAKSELKVVE